MIRFSAERFLKVRLFGQPHQQAFAYGLFPNMSSLHWESRLALLNANFDHIVLIACTHWLSSNLKPDWSLKLELSTQQDVDDQVKPLSQEYSTQIYNHYHHTYWCFERTRPLPRPTPNLLSKQYGVIVSVSQALLLIGSWLIDRPSIECMMNIISTKLICRLLRNRLVLLVIFGLSFTYSMYSLIRSPAPSSPSSYPTASQQGILLEYETNVDVDKILSRIRPRMRMPPLSARTRGEMGMGMIDSDGTKGTSVSSPSGSSKSCRNSVQGKVLIADDRGFVCQRKDVNVATGCCRENLPETHQYHCETCLDTGCCAIYEYCISCCM